MSRERAHRCPSWCVANHRVEDESGVPRHRGETLVVPGIAIRPGSPRSVEGIELLVELHADDGDPVVAVYIGDGGSGLDLTTETAARLLRRLSEALHSAGIRSA